MMEQDIFVGIVALALGLFVTASALLNTGAFSRFWLARRVEAAWGSRTARGVGAMIGLLVTFLGVLLVLGFLAARRPVAQSSTGPLEFATLPVKGFNPLATGSRAVS